jgi:hypothetical protein
VRVLEPPPSHNRVFRPAVTVTLEAGGADTYTQRAIPGPESRLGLLHLPPARRQPYPSDLHYQLGSRTDRAL